MERIRNLMGYRSLGDGSQASGSGRGDKKGKNKAKELVYQATNNFLVSPDWGLNMEVVDFANGAARKDQERVVKQLIERFCSKDSDEVGLALTLTEACIKNCSGSFHQCASDLRLPSKLASLASSNKLGIDAHRTTILQMLQEWREAIPFPDFSKAYCALLAQGTRFPRTNSAPVRTPPCRYVTPEMKEEAANRRAIAEALGHAVHNGTESHSSSQPCTMDSSFSSQSTNTTENVAFHSPMSGLYSERGLVPAGYPTRAAVDFRQPQQTMNAHMDPTTVIPENAMPLPATSSAMSVSNVQHLLDVSSNSCTLFKDILDAVDSEDVSAITTALNDELMGFLLQQCKHAKEQINKCVPDLHEEWLLGKALELNDRLNFSLRYYESLERASKCVNSSSNNHNEAVPENRAAVVGLGDVDVLESGRPPVAVKSLSSNSNEADLISFDNPTPIVGQIALQTKTQQDGSTTRAGGAESTQNSKNDTQAGRNFDDLDLLSL
mmetsp:Transcript_3463/g.8609  ORF Transcript_3463/g.8609 Transcript_3463/m.8609 type:complete len:494 (+) Transcript_3463:511-1992(+)